MDALDHLSILTGGSLDEFCADWIAAWNAHDLERILAHYREDVLFTSPFAARAGAPDGVLRGLPALRSYFDRALATYPDLQFEAIAALSGVDSVALHYRSVEDCEAIEVMQLDQRWRVHRVFAHYTSPPAPETS
jgi:SnoaL-like domain